MCGYAVDMNGILVDGVIIEVCNSQSPSERSLLNPT